MLQFSFRKCFLLSHPPLKPDSQPLQQLLPPQSVQTNLLKSYSFSQLKMNESKQKLIKYPQQANSEQLQKYKQKCQTMQKQNNILKQENQKLKKFNNQYLDDLQEIRLKYASLIKMYQQSANQHNIGLQQQIIFLKAELRIVKLQLQKKEEQIINFQLKNEQSKKLLQKLNENITKKQDKLIKQKNQLTKKIQQKDKAMNQLSQKIQQLNELILQIKRQKDETIQKISKQISQKSNYHNKMNVLLQQIQRKESQLIEADNKYKNFELKYKNLEFQFKKLNQDHNVKINHAFQTLDKEKTNKNELQIQIFRLEEQKENMQKDIQQFKTIIEDLKQKYQKESKNLYSNEESFRRLQKKNQTLEIQVKERDFQIQITNQQIQKLGQLIQQLREDKKTLLKDKNQLKNELNDKIVKLQKLQRQIEVIKQGERTLKKLSQSWEFQKQKFFQNEAKQIQQISYLQRQLKQKEQNQKKYELQIFSKQKQIETLNQQIDKYKIKYSKLDRIYSMYKEQIANKNKNTQKNWIQLKDVYQQQIIQLQEKLKSVQNRKNIFPGQILTSRVSLRKNQQTEKQSKQRLFQTNGKLQSHSNYQGSQKQNVWRGLNNDSLQIQE